jgi:hypothetical protein
VFRVEDAIDPASRHVLAYAEEWGWRAVLRLH